MSKWRLFAMIVCILGCSLTSRSQRVYAPHSVLSNGEWFKIATRLPGIYKIDLPLLASLGVNTSNIASASIRLFGNGGAMLAEANAGPWTDDLKENSIQVVDGGDGILNGSDYILFFSAGPDQWINEPANQRFSHRKNLFSDKAFYFLNISGVGKRVSNAPLLTSPTTTITSFSDRYFHELDSLNFLAGSKEWYGEEMSSLPGRSLTRSFTVPINNAVANSIAQVRGNVVARSVGISSRIDLRIDNQPAAQLPINPVGGGPYDLFAQAGNITGTGTAQSNLNISFTYVPGSFNAQGWINWFEVFARRNISLTGIDRLLFRDWLSVGNNTGEFVVSNATSNTEVWDITDPFSIQRMQGSFANSTFRFVNNCTSLREYIAFNPANLLLPQAMGKVPNQDLHNVAPTDFLIVTHPSFLSQAQRLAGLHQQHDGLRTIVITTDQVYNEFSSGSPDPTGIRDFVKMYYDKFASQPASRPQYLLLFGDASFDYKDRLVNNTSFVPAYQNDLALDPLSSYTSDDFFGFLDDNEDIQSGLVTNLLDIGIGRVPCRSIEEAKDFTDKLSNYFSPESFGPWRNNFTFIADDEDNNLHLQDAEIFTTTANTTAPVFNQQKIYLDAYHQEAGAGGSSYPQAVATSNNQLYNGTLIWNYSGHGGSRRLAEETILDQEMINSLNNPNKLPLFITATCDFAPYDNPLSNSLGENILLRPKTGAIALLTTTRIVFSSSNRIINNNYLQFALQQGTDGRYKTLGTSLKEAKNFTYQNSTDITNNRKFTLLGDPALTIAFPTLKARITRVNNIPAATVDTLQPMEKTVIEGEVTDAAGVLLPGFNGYVYPVVFDKPQIITTLGNDATSTPVGFQALGNTIFKGKASVTNGKFSFTFKVPKDIRAAFGNGRLSVYAANGTADANGLFTNFMVGGIGSGIDADKTGPVIKAYLNDELFANGGITNQHPILLVKLTDSSGINTTGTGIGHDIVATLDHDNRQYFILNDFYESNLDSYQQGSVRFQLPELESGTHSLQIKAWDVLNNSNETILDFVVAKDEELSLSHVLNYPNPFTTHTSFWFEHNKPGQSLKVLVQVMTITGRVVKSIQRTITTSGNRSADIEWDGRDDYGDKLGRGVYLYKLQVISPDNKRKEVLEKLVIL